MSHYMTALAIMQPGLKPATKIVLYWLADHHNETDGRCFPSINRLAELCEMSRRSVENHLSELESRGLISRREMRRDGGGKTSNSYTLSLQDPHAQNLRIPPAKSAHGDTQNLRINNLVRNNLGKEPSFSKQGNEKGEVQEAFEFFKAVAARIEWPVPRELTNPRKAALLLRMKEAGGLQGWKAQITKAEKSNFLSGKKTGTTPANFDWIMTKANFAKLMEGNYDNPKPAKKAEKFDPTLAYALRSMQRQKKQDEEFYAFSRGQSAPLTSRKASP
ncbi:helix-turn-helix domain-containing protein [Donghicola tyrosinivorans]|uniref:Helix-turn-helix protein n=1 Tax=Donghicola tyrosinivorans TaxID=1652492 RepID=A0A2T0WGE5_9RHOB|nr:helix-turn-helix domain-containing protein [Donghicola tyrosinivorans]PRY85780.1 helix-turn-helix protein [Donghicola tyrosinivorans]